MLVFQKSPGHFSNAALTAPRAKEGYENSSTYSLPPATLTAAETRRSVPARSFCIQWMPITKMVLHNEIHYDETRFQLINTARTVSALHATAGAAGRRARPSEVGEGDPNRLHRIRSVKRSLRTYTCCRPSSFNVGGPDPPDGDRYGAWREIPVQRIMAGRITDYPCVCGPGAHGYAVPSPPHRRRRPNLPVVLHCGIHPTSRTRNPRLVEAPDKHPQCRPVKLVHASFINFSGTFTIFLRPDSSQLSRSLLHLLYEAQ